jgi:hypothetical protein
VRDAATPLRTGYETALQGNITVNATVLPVYYGKVPSNVSSDFFILIPEISATQRKLMRVFVADAKVYIDIIRRVATDVSAEAVESAADQILQIIKPTPNTKGITVASPFKLITVSLDSNDQNRTVQVDAAKFVVSKSLTFNNIIQN